MPCLPKPKAALPVCTPTPLGVSPDPIYPGREIFYIEATGVYMRPLSPNTSEPLYFAGTDPRDPGFPPPEDEAEVGNPRVQWESVE